MTGGTMIINGQHVHFENEKNVLAVIRKAGISLPTFCYNSDLSVYGACRMCMVENLKTGKLDAACSMVPADGLEINTNSGRLIKHRRMILELLLASHDCDCTCCEKSGNCRLQELAQQFGIRQVRFKDTREPVDKDESSFAITRDPNKCILCGDCVRVCEEMQGVGILKFAYRGANTRVTPAFGDILANTKCVSCGQCAAACPTGAIIIKNQIGEAWRAIDDKTKRVVVQIAPSVRVAIGEAFNIPSGENCIAKLVSALKLMGVDKVYDTNFAADITTITEGKEFLERVKNGGPFPMFTSCCPAWVNYVEKNRPDLLPNISSCKSPMEMFAAVLRDKYAKKDAADGLRTYHIAIMPCTAKKFEAQRPEFTTDGMPDVDLVLTTKEVIKMIEETGIKLDEMDLESPDTLFGMSSGSALLYGVTGGVAESVVRYCYPDKSKNALRDIKTSGLRGEAAIREVTFNIDGEDINIAICNGLVNAKNLLAEIKEGKKNYHLIEVMTCRGGCVGGAGQPSGFWKIKRERRAGLYAADDISLFKRAERNPMVMEMLNEYGAKRCHELLHVDYLANNKG